MSFYLGAGVNGQFDVVKCDLDLVLLYRQLFD